jgi:crotonobetainyl-CoA:carnitine CoA-transferase CaiB-like acyl-CoA transferase
MSEDNDSISTPQTPEKSFSQEDVERIVKERIATAKKKEAEKFADYEELKAAAARLAELEGSNKSELEKAFGERDEFKTKYEELNGKIETWKKRQDNLKAAKKLFEEAQIRSEGWEYLEDVIGPADTEESIREKLEKARRITGVRDVGSSGRTPPPATSKAPTVKEQLAAEMQKPKPDQLRIIQLRGRIAAGEA